MIARNVRHLQKACAALCSRIHLSRSKAYLIALLLLIVFHAVNNYIIVSANRAPPYHYAGSAIIEQDRLLAILADGGAGIHYFLQNSYPALLVFILYPYYWLVGVTQVSVIMGNTLFLAVLVLSVFAIGKKLHSAKTGLLAAFIVTAFPQILGLSRHYDLRLHLAAAASAGIYLLLKSGGLSRHVYSLLFGISVGIGISIKPEYSIYLIGPFAVVLIKAALSAESAGKRMVLLTNLLAASLGFSLAVLGNGGLNLRNIAHVLFAMSFPVTGTTPDYFFYLRSLLGFQTLFLLSPLILAASAYFLYRRQNYVVLAWFFLPFAFFTFVVYTNLDINFMTPALPAAAVLTALFVHGIRNVRIRRLMIAAIICICLFQFFLLSYVPQSYPAFEAVNSAAGIGRIQMGPMHDILHYDEMAGSFPGQVQYMGFLHPYNSDWGIGYISSLIMNNSGGKRLHIAVIDAGIYHIIYHPLGYKLYELGHQTHDIVPLEDLILENPASPQDAAGLIQKILAASDFVIFTSMGSEVPEVAQIINATKETPLGWVALPDATVVYVYARQ
ncbi:MAG: glycosyltransferase family 39 protein [archaeon]